MSIFHKPGKVALFCYLLLLSAKVQAVGGLTCQRILQDHFHETLAQEDSVEDTRYEFSYVKEGHTWVGMFINIAYVSDDNPMTSGISTGDKSEELQSLLVVNFKRLILESGAYEKVSDIEFHDYNNTPVVTFNAKFGEVVDTYAISGAWNNFGFDFYRLYVISNGMDDDLISAGSVSNALAKIIEGCATE